MSALVVLPILVPLTTAVACLFAWRRRGLQRALSVGGAALLLLVAAGLLDASAVPDLKDHKRRLRRACRNNPSSSNSQ